MNPVVNVEVGSVYSRLLGAPLDLHTTLLARYAIPVKNAYFIRRRFGWDGYVRFYFHDGRFYSGLLPAIVDAIEAAQCTAHFRDARAKPVQRPFPALRLTLRDYQTDEVAAAFAAGRGVIHAATNSGKTELAIALTKMASTRTLFMVPTVELVEKTRQRYADVFGTRSVGVITGGRAEPDAPVVVSNVQSLSRYVRAAPQDERTKLGSFTRQGRQFLASFGALIGDEVHLLTSLEWSKLTRECPAYYRWALSATPYGDDKARAMLLTGLFGESVGEITQAFLAARGLSAHITVRILPYVPGALLGREHWARQLEAGIVRNISRNTLIAQTLTADAAAGLRVAVLVERYEHAHQIAALLPRHVTWQFATGQNRADRNTQLATFKSGTVPILFATRVLGLGVNIAEMDRLFIAAGGRSATATVQRAGRLVRTRADKQTAILYDCCDVGLYHADVATHKRHLERHFWARVRAYASEGFTIQGRPRRQHGNVNNEEGGDT
jgi:superfamily II DNA or RNA helicase